MVVMWRVLVIGFWSFEGGGRRWGCEGVRVRGARGFRLELGWWGEVDVGSGCVFRGLGLGVVIEG